MVATLERTETRMRPVLTIDAQGGISQARVSASAAGLGQLTNIARGTPGLTSQITAAPIREFETG